MGTHPASCRHHTSAADTSSKLEICPLVAPVLVQETDIHDAVTILEIVLDPVHLNVVSTFQGALLQ